MPAGPYDIIIEQNSTFQLDVYWVNPTGVPVNLTGYTAKMQVRSAIGSSTVLLTLTDTNGGVVLGTTDGHLQLSLTAAATNALTWTNAVYDLDLVSPTGFATRLLEGAVTVHPAVTTI